jgi:hypothetical protein
VKVYRIKNTELAFATYEQAEAHVAQSGGSMPAATGIIPGELIGGLGALLALLGQLKSTEREPVDPAAPPGETVPVDPGALADQSVPPAAPAAPPPNASPATDPPPAAPVAA